jgi:hypothetical protein
VIASCENRASAARRSGDFNGEPYTTMSQQNDYPTHDDIAALAQKFWEEEGQPEGKAVEHWQRAEEQLRQSQQSDAEAQSQAA